MDWLMGSLTGSSTGSAMLTDCQMDLAATDSHWVNQRGSLMAIVTQTDSPTGFQMDSEKRWGFLTEMASQKAMRWGWARPRDFRWATRRDLGYLMEIHSG